MTLLVRNEEDIVRANIEFHLAQGVDFIIATDNGSTDGTIDILEEYRRAGALRLIHESADDYSQARWVTRMARMAHAEHGANWIINNDADEFWWPLEGNLRTALDAIEPHAGVVVVERKNFVPMPVTPGPFYERMLFRERESYNSLGDPLPAKVCCRGVPGLEIAQGNHAATAPHLGPVSNRHPIVILHFPLRSFAQFEKKIACGGAAYERNVELAPEVGITWRALYREYLGSRLASYFESQVPSPALLADRVASGDLIHDTRLRDILQRLTR